MKIAPLNGVQIALMILMVVCPMVGVDWPRTATAMQIATACSAASLGVVSLYATPIVPTSLLSAVGIQEVHVIQGMIGTVITILNGSMIGHPSWGPVIRVVSDVGTIFMGVLGIFSPKALNGMIMARRIRKIAAASILHTSVTPDPPPTPKEGLPKG